MKLAFTLFLGLLLLPSVVFAQTDIEKMEEGYQRAIFQKDREIYKLTKKMEALTKELDFAQRQFIQGNKDLLKEYEKHVILEKENKRLRQKTSELK